MTNEASSNEAPAVRPLPRRVVGIASSNRSRAVAEIEIDEAGGLHISATVTDTAGGYRGGQCLDSIQADAERIAEEPGGRRHMVESDLLDLCDIWGAWHLNTMRAGCEHQTGPQWDPSARVVSRRFSIEWEDLRKLERHSRVMPDRAPMGSELQRATDAAARVLLLNGASVRPFEWVPLPAGWEDVLARQFEIVAEHERAAYLKACAERQENTFGLGRWTWRGQKRMSEPKPPVLVRKVSNRVGELRPDQHPEGLLCKPCPVCGYKYGSAWRTVPLPADVVAAVHRIAGGAVTPPDESAALEALGFRLTCKSITKRTDQFAGEWEAGARHWLCRLERNRQVMDFPYSQGSAHTEPPKLADVLDCLRRDASLAADEDEAQACGVKLSQWETLKAQAHAFRVLCGDAAEAVGL